MAPEYEKSFSDAVRDAAGNIAEIVRGEFRLAKIELSDAAKSAAFPLVVVITGGLLAACALAFLLLALLFALNIVFPEWLSALIVCALCIIAAGASVAAGMQKLGRIHPLFARTTKNVKEQLQWTKQHVR